MRPRIVMFPGNLADELDLVSRVEARSRSEVIRTAVDRHLSDRQADRGLPESLQRVVLDRKIPYILPDRLADEIDRIASIDGVKAAAAVREAVRKYVVAQTADPGFRERLRKMLQRDIAIARRLAPPTAPVQQDIVPAGRG